MVRRSRNALLSLPFYLWLALGLIGPIAIIVVTSFLTRSPFGQVEWTFTLDAYRTLFDYLYLNLFMRSLGLAAGNTALTIAIAYPVAYYLTKLSPTKRTWLLTLILIPFWTSFLVRVLGFMEFLRLEPLGIKLLYTYFGVLLSMCCNYLPFALLPLYAEVSKIPRSVIEAAQDLGATRWQIFTRVFLPLSKRGLIVASMLVFIPSLGEFLIPDLVGGGRVYGLGSFLQNQFLSARNWPLGSATLSLMLIITFIAAKFFLNHESENEAMR
ncbi:MAG TPA: ABC transporter permease [Bdellovibrionota bacterium]|jgi:spermidine/putrescine transport system permease protein|nr:ABC transporter permease [Bdellovibrionota bacterium]